MKTNNRKIIKVALVWAAILLISSLLFRYFELSNQSTSFFIIIAAAYISLSLNGSNKLSCKTEKNNLIK